MSGASQYFLRVDDKSNGWTGTCASVNPGDTCLNDVVSTSYTRAIVPGRDYQAWVHAYRVSDGSSSGATSLNFKCDPPPTTVSGRVYRQNADGTRTGYAGVSFVSACINGQSVTTDANGNYSFSLPYNFGFCLRLNPEARAGMTGPVPLGYPASLQGMKTYEFQRAGIHCAVTGCGGNWDTHDRSVDSGYDFVYTPAPTTVSGRVYNQTTNTGYAGVAIATCVTGVSATTNATGYFSFTVPYDQGYCVRVTPFAQPGVTGPSPSSYEFQRAGRHCGGACGGNWDTYDRATDDDMDFVYTSVIPLPSAPTLTFTADSYSLPVNGATTLRWTSTDATSCTASRSPVGGTWTGGKGAVSGQNYTEPTGALASGLYTYALTCTNSVGVSVTRSLTIGVALPALGTPVISHSCGAGGTSVTLNYGVTGATSYSLRVDDTTNGWTGTCATVNPGDTCIGGIGPSYTRSIVPGRAYTAWVHAHRSFDSAMTNSAAHGFSCAPAATPTLNVNVTANPTSGNAPLSSNITANLGGTATGNATYRFDCTNDGTYEHVQTSGANSLSYTCTYSTPGTTFTPRVNVTREGVTNNGTATVTTNANYTLTVSVIGNGSVTSNPPSITNCTTNCTASFPSVPPVELTPTPAPGSIFIGWEGDCNGTGTCALYMNANKTVTAHFMTSLLPQ